MTSNSISLNPSYIARALGAVALFLVLASTAGQLTVYLTGHERVYGLVRLFNVGTELNLPAFFSTFILVFAALLLAVITVLEKKRQASHVFHWAVLAFGFLFMAVDEAVTLHEMMVEPTRKLLGDGNLGAFYFAWVIPGIVIVLVLGLYFLKFLLHLPAKTRFTFLMAAIIYLGGAIGFELLGGRYAELHGTHNLAYNMISTVEESLEMAGVIIFIRSLLMYIASNFKEVQFRLDGVQT
ncbi:MAG: hypothetical protein ACOH2B_10145 [Burkholderiaceae bacterium]